MHTDQVHLPIRHLAPPTGQRVDLWLSRPAQLQLPGGTGSVDLPTTLQQRRLQRRFFLRLLLGAYLDRPGKDVTVARQSRGKPVLVGGGLSFSLSHSADWLLIAVAGSGEVGVDLEAPRRMPNAAALAGRYFTRAEARWLATQPAVDRERAFLRLWTAKEAMVKAAGTGLAGFIQRVEIDLESSPRLRAVPGDWEPASRWSLQELALPDGLLGHLAITQRDAECVLHHVVGA